MSYQEIRGTLEFSFLKSQKLSWSLWESALLVTGLSYVSLEASLANFCTNLSLVGMGSMRLTNLWMKVSPSPNWKAIEAALAEMVQLVEN